jgi:hypothetical protein
VNLCRNSVTVRGGDFGWANTFVPAADYDRGLLKIRFREVAKSKAEPKKITVRR